MKQPFAQAALVACFIAASSCTTPEPNHATPPIEAPLTSLTPVAKGIEAQPTTRAVLRLDNGITAVLTQAQPGHDANIQLGFVAGSSFVAPGLCELAAHVLADGADPSLGRPSLRQSIVRLGGTLAIEIGPLTTWLDVRVPASAWQEALVAMKKALATPLQSRNQIERVRADMVAERIAAIRRAPGHAMARLLLLGENGSASHVNALLDRDPAEISAFRSRLFTFDRTLLVADLPVTTAAASHALGTGGTVGLGSLVPEPPVPGPTGLLDRRFESGLYVARDTAPSATPAVTRRLTVVQLLPDVTSPDAAEMLAAHCCLTLDGTGGRLERMQQDVNLSAILWRSEIVQTPDATALVLSADVLPTDVLPVWRLLQSVRASLQAVPPTASEVQLALTRVPLTARLGFTNESARLRLQTQMALKGGELAAIDRRVAAIRTMQDVDLSTPIRNFLAQPFAMVVSGGEVADLPAEARVYDVLPIGHEPAVAAVAPETAAKPAVAPTPWLDHAVAAVGGKDLLARLEGWKSEADFAHDQAPAMHESCEWNANGTLRRVRELVGSKVETTLDGVKWSEMVGDVNRSLDAAEAGWLRREQQRHPLAVLSAAARGELTFTPVAQRDSGDRTVMVLETRGERFDRLRLHLDTQSHLVRVVESWETLPDGTAIHVHDAWSDYRNAGGVRAPFRRLCTHDDGQNRVETMVRSWDAVWRR